MEERNRENNEAREEDEEAEEETNVDGDNDEEDDLLDNDGARRANELRKLINSQKPKNQDKNLFSKLGYRIGAAKRNDTNRVKGLLSKKLGFTVIKNDGISSRVLIEKSKILYDGKTVTGLSFGGVKIFEVVDKVLVEVDDTDNEVVNALKKFNELVKEAELEHKGTSAANVEEIIKQQNLEPPSEVMVKSILQETLEKVYEVIEENSKVILDSSVITKNERAELLKMFSPLEFRELGIGVDEDELPKGDTKKERRKILSGKLVGYEREADEWGIRAEGSVEGSERERVFRLAERTAKLLGDRLRLVNGLRIKGEEGLKILNEEVNANDLTKFERFKKWSKENLGTISVVTISAAGIITTIVMGARDALKAFSSPEPFLLGHSLKIRLWVRRLKGEI